MAFLATLRDALGGFFVPKTLDRRGEAAAAKYLRRRGYKIVARNYRDRFGEIDLVAVDGRTVVFAEVKTRVSTDKGHPADAVDADKQRRLTRLALAYLKRHGLLEYRSRFDVLAVLWPKNARRPTLEHFQNAFEAVGRDQLFS